MDITSSDHDEKHLKTPRRSLFTKKRRLAGCALFGLVALAALIAVFGWWLPHRRAQAEARALDRDAASALRAGDLEKAENSWLLSLAAWPEDANAYSALGDFYRDNAQADDAMVSYQQALRASGHYPHVYCRLAEVARTVGNAQMAYSCCRKELALDKRCVRALDILADMDDRSGEHEKASKEIAEAYQIDPSNEHTVTLYAELIMNTEPDRAAAILIKAQPQHPDSAALAFELGWCYARATGSLASVGNALQQLQRAEKLDPEMGVVHKELCRLLLEQKAGPDAVREGALAARYSPQDPQSYLYYSQALSRTGHTAEGQKVLARFNAMQAAHARQSVLNQTYSEKPGDPAIAHELAALDNQLGDERDALTVLRVAHSAHPDDPQITADLNRAIMASNRP